MILITSPHPDFTKSALTICENYKLDIKVVDAFLENSVKIVQDILNDKNMNEEIDVIVSRGGTADALKASIELPIITADVTDFDVIEAIWKAKEFGNTIGYLGFNNDQRLYDFSLISKLLEVKIKIYSYSNTKEIEDQLDQASRDGIKTMIVGSYFAEVRSEHLSFNTVLVRSGERAFLQAISRAKEIVDAISYEREMFSRLKTIMNLSGEGIISVDNNERINFLNLAAESILKINKRDFIGKNINKTLLSELADSLSLNKPIISKIEKINNEELITNYFPIKSSNQNCGMVINFSNIKQIQKKERIIRKELHEKGLTAQYAFDDIIGKSEKLLRTISVAKKFGLAEHTVIIRGETGTGKEMFANSIHNTSLRASEAFVAVNCGALPENLLDSELFGYKEGAFTGALKGGKIGLIELAHRGTLFLDEIDKMPLDLQVKILRVLQEKEIRPIGSDKVVPVDVRIIAASNRDLLELTMHDEFLKDLYFRLNVLNLQIPPLRERKEDTFLLMNFFCQKHSPSISIDIFTPEIKEKFLDYNWPGNIRELENLVKRYLTLISSEGKEIKKKNLKYYFPELYNLHSLQSEVEIDNNKYLKVIPGSFKQMKYQMIYQLYNRFDKNKTKLASYLGISRNTVTQIIKECDESTHYIVL